jgi:hypothetical protein
MMGSRIFKTVIAADFGDAERNDLMRKVWAPTPWIVDCRTDSAGTDRSRDIMDWCRDRWGDECWPIHGRPGRWQRGSATVFGYTWFGFETEAMMNDFAAAWETNAAETA